jgi:transcription factor C subunit 6
VINTIVYSPFGAGVATIDHENIVKMYSASPSMIGRGHTLLESGGPVCVSHELASVHDMFEPLSQSIGCSDYHPIIAVGSADGSCMTSNVLKSTRKGGLVRVPLPNSLVLDQVTSTPCSPYFPTRFTSWITVLKMENTECWNNFFLEYVC